MDFSLEVLNYFRVCYIAVNIIPDGLRAVFKQEWDSLYNATAFGGWKDTPQNGFDFYNTEPLRSRIKNARLLMTILGGNTEKWDCSCLFFAILFSDTIGKTLSPVVRREVDNLRQIQDDIAHINEFALTDAEFYHYVARVLAAFSFLQLPINAVDDIKKQTVFPSSELAALSIKTHDLRVDVQRKEQETKNLTLELQSMKKEVETSTQEINSKIESFCILTSKPSHPIIRRVNDVTRVVKKLDELQNRSKGAISTVYLSGIPGCGKSQIARQVGEEIFFKRWLEDRTFVATLNAETLVSLAESYCSLARHFGITEYALATLEASRNLHEKIAYLKTSIFSKTKQFSNWLIIVDNVVDLSLVRDDLPPSGRKEFGHGQVLITIQDPRSIPSFASLTYHESVSKGMRPDEAVDLLRLVSEIQNQEEAEKVAEVLEYQPLALANAAFYVQTVVVSGSPNYSWANYLETLRRRRLRESQMPLVPSEIKARGRKAMLVYENALKTGKVKVYRARIMFIGQDRAGKTSLKNSFLGLPFDREQQSTDGIEMDPSKFEVIVDQVCNWKRTVDVSQFAHSLARVVAGKLEQEQTEVDPAQSVGFDGLRAQMDPKPQDTSAEDKSQISQGTIGKEGEGKKEAVAISELKIDPVFPPKTFTDLIVQRLESLNLESDTTGAEHHMILDLWDFAGQHLYYTFYPVFLSSRAVYLLVYNLNKGLNEIALPCFRRGVFNIPLKNTSRETNLENVLTWLVTVSSICSSQSETAEGEKKEADLDLPYSRPPVFIVGTHADKKQHKEIMEMESQIMKEISSKDYESHVMTPFFSVDNTQGSSDHGVASLQKKIIEVLKREPYMGEEIPMRWFNFEKVVRELVAADVYYLKLDQLNEIIRKVCCIETEDEAAVMLNFYHDLGKIVKHHNTVILRAKWLIDVFKKLVTICPNDESEPKKRKLWRRMEETGVLEMELVDHVFSAKFRHHKEDILDMMEQFGLIVKFTESPGNEIYFVPCQLQTPPDDLCKIEPLPSELCPLYLLFSGNFVPYGFFSQLVSRCVSWCSSAGFGLPNLFDGASRFLIGKEQNHQLILVCKKRFIKVILKQIKQQDLPLDETKLQDAAMKVRTFLEDTIGALSHELSGFKNITYELCVECPYCLEGQKTCHDHSQFPCDNEYCMCLLKVTADGSFEYCRKSYACVKPKLPQLQRWFPFKDMSPDKVPTFTEPKRKASCSQRIKDTDMSQEEQSVHPVSKRKASCSDPQLPKRMKRTVKKGTPSDEDLEELSQQIGKSWRPLGRRLQFTEAELIAFHKENQDEYSEKAYQMLLRWKSRDGKDATYQVLYDALDHKLVKEKRLAEEICCD